MSVNSTGLMTLIIHRGASASVRSYGTAWTVRSRPYGCPAAALLKRSRSGAAAALHQAHDPVNTDSARVHDRHELDGLSSQHE